MPDNTFLSTATTGSGINWSPAKDPDPKPKYLRNRHNSTKSQPCDVPVFVVGFLQVPDLGHGAAAPLHRQAPAARQHQVLHLCVVMQEFRDQGHREGGEGSSVLPHVSVSTSQRKQYDYQQCCGTETVYSCSGSESLYDFANVRFRFHIQNWIRIHIIFIIFQIKHLKSNIVTQQVGIKLC